MLPSGQVEVSGDLLDKGRSQSNAGLTLPLTGVAVTLVLVAIFMPVRGESSTTGKGAGFSELNLPATKAGLLGLISRRRREHRGGRNLTQSLLQRAGEVAFGLRLRCDNESGLYVAESL